MEMFLKGNGFPYKKFGQSEEMKNGNG